MTTSATPPEVRRWQHGWEVPVDVTSETVTDDDGTERDEWTYDRLVVDSLDVDTVRAVASARGTDPDAAAEMVREVSLTGQQTARRRQIKQGVGQAVADLRTIQRAAEAGNLSSGAAVQAVGRLAEILRQVIVLDVAPDLLADD